VKRSEAAPFRYPALSTVLTFEPYNFHLVQISHPPKYYHSHAVSIMNLANISFPKLILHIFQFVVKPYSRPCARPENQAYVLTLCPAQGRIWFPFGILSIMDSKNSFFVDCRVCTRVHLLFFLQHKFETSLTLYLHRDLTQNHPGESCPRS
jgi:hypothetical protein